MPEQKKAMVVFTEYSPYLVVDVKDVEKEDGNKVAMQQVTALCRCGASSMKPYCDGSHAKIGFVGTKSTDYTPGEDKQYVGKGVTIHDNRGICAHSGNCINGLPGVFRQNGKPWIDPDGAPVEEIIATIKKCPSGALSYSIDGVLNKNWDSPNPKIIVAKNGPYNLTGFIEIKDAAESQPEAKGHCTLCRCGGAKNKPFCDGSHLKTGFDDEK